MLHKEKTQSIIGAFFDVYNKLGNGFLEKVYENALAHELRKRGHKVQQQATIDVYYDEQLVGKFFADLLVDDCIIVELKAVEELHPRHEAQLLNYLKATNVEVGLLLNFGPKAVFKRKVFTKSYKNPKNPRKSA
ncbi:MAG: GxxExxY protein [Anaerolineae bacterium]